MGACCGRRARAGTQVRIGNMRARSRSTGSGVRSREWGARVGRREHGVESGNGSGRAERSSGAGGASCAVATRRWFGDNSSALRADHQRAICQRAIWT